MVSILNFKVSKNFNGVETVIVYRVKSNHKNVSSKRKIIKTFLKPRTRSWKFCRCIHYDIQTAVSFRFIFLKSVTEPLTNETFDKKILDQSVSLREYFPFSSCTNWWKFDQRRKLKRTIHVSCYVKILVLIDALVCYKCDWIS